MQPSTLQQLLKQQTGSGGVQAKSNRAKSEMKKTGVYLIPSLIKTNFLIFLILLISIFVKPRTRFEPTPATGSASMSPSFSCFVCILFLNRVSLSLKSTYNIGIKRTKKTAAERIAEKNRDAGDRKKTINAAAGAIG